MSDPPAPPAIPTEVELVFEVMPCNAMRTAEHPNGEPHPCTYFGQWGTYHGYDYRVEGPPATPGIVHQSRYVGRVTPVPELLSGCRKAPIMAVGINPNLPGWWPATRRSLTPYFDDYRQYAHYFRYRSTEKLELPAAAYRRFGGGRHDTPFSGFELEVPANRRGERRIPVKLQPQKMYRVYQGLLDSLAAGMRWRRGTLTVGEDLSYGNMVASASAKWTTKPDPNAPELPPMTDDQRTGIVTECFRTRKYLLRQLFQSLPAVMFVFGQNTANAFLAELGSRIDNAKPGDSIAALARRTTRLTYGTLPGGTELSARVIFAPHPTGDPDRFAAARDRVVRQLLAEARTGALSLNPDTGHLARTVGSCVFCPMLDIGPCDYAAELTPLEGGGPQFTAAAPDKPAQAALAEGIIEQAVPVAQGWASTDDG